LTFLAAISGWESSWPGSAIALVIEKLFSRSGIEMISNYKLLRNAALSFVMAGGMAGFTTIAQAHGYSQSQVRAAQQQLKNDGYYTGAIDGVDGTMTRTAIRHYQRDNNLAVSGRLDKQARDKLGVQSGSEASREAVPPASSTSGITPSEATIKAAQQKLEQTGFYKGNIDGMYSSEMRAAVREYQQNSHLTVTGQLDQDTLSKLGVSK
jgi:peptidoglycan hydrolase-like protein with peptidoglycan-binding domain